MAEKVKMRVEKTLTNVIRVCEEFFNLFGIAAFAVFASWGLYYGAARFGMLPNFEISLESLCWVMFVEFVTIMATTFAVRLHDGYYDKD